MFPNNPAKVAFIVTHLTGRAGAWATTEWARDTPVCKSLPLFTDTLSKIFDHILPVREAARALVPISQNSHRLADYAIEFLTLAADSGWNSTALYDAFLNDLADPIKYQLAPLDLPSDLDSVIAMGIRIDSGMIERQRNAAHPAP